jgi:hypothetical protein
MSANLPFVAEEAKGGTDGFGDKPLFGRDALDPAWTAQEGR